MRSTWGSVIMILSRRFENNSSGFTPKIGINNDNQKNSMIAKAKKLNRLAIKDKLKSPFPIHVNITNNKTTCKIVCTPKGIRNNLTV